ncbi:Secreted protein containing C-terminal beta-propeller domain [Micromonospora nigra]|uniref:Secreted protein containing C-terminal beta-propeller domain n=1 Tax=Micromonospora nigra TaxID=145857 RepID=A0A1C6RZ22_9ACTN|nr:beta-propeller domain-containing protein [Micromonospora nigra]SCL22423.1 Secreted protein containing C-terminal beta-propeller domain [Micromonospora nigra]
MTRGTRTTGALLAALAVLAACTEPPPVRLDPDGPRPVPASRLVAYDSCAEALAELRAAAVESVGPYGFGGGWLNSVPFGEAEAATVGGASRTKDARTHSTTNNHEAGADEPDVVKTDGRRIVTVQDGVLRVVDPASRRETGRLDVSEGRRELRWASYELLLRGDRALVLADSVSLLPARPEPAAGARLRPGPPAERGARLLLVDLAGTPRVLGTYRIRGTAVDARLTADTARVAIRTAARFDFPHPKRGTQESRVEANRSVIANSGIDAWLPAYEWTDGDQRHTGRVGCDRLSRPDRLTGTTTLTLLSFDLTGDRLGDGDPVSVAADADTVYATASNLYLAGVRPVPGRPWTPRWTPTPGEQITEIHQFDTAAAGRPRYLATGAVSGWLVNQYALSEWQGHLRVATTTGDLWGRERTSESAVRVLRRVDSALVETGAVGGLGRGERIYSVRYLGDRAHVVTFRQTDPLYSLDLTDPRRPRVTGELKITGYSAYLHPMPDGHLLGVGQEADARGRTQGVQVSLFDVRDPAKPSRTARWHLPGATTAVEFEPHAFLHQPETGLVALPVNGDVRLLRVGGDSIADLGAVSHPGNQGRVERSLLVDGVLWTVSDTGLRASDPTTAASLAWLPWT